MATIQNEQWEILAQVSNIMKMKYYTLHIVKMMLGSLRVTGHKLIFLSNHRFSCSVLEILVPVECSSLKLFSFCHLSVYTFSINWIHFCSKWYVIHFHCIYYYFVSRVKTAIKLKFWRPLSEPSQLGYCSIANLYDKHPKHWDPDVVHCNFFIHKWRCDYTHGSW